MVSKIGSAALEPLTKSFIGLSNVDNTADTNKPVSTAMATALSAKLDKSGGAIGGSLAAYAMTISGASGQSGGTLNLAKAPSGTLGGDVSVDVNNNAIRFFENGGDLRGYYLDFTQGGNGVSKNLLDRASQFGQQPISTVSGLQTLLDNLQILAGGYALPENYGYDDSGTLAQQNTAMQAWAAAGRSGQKLGIGAKTYNFTQQLNITGTHRMKIRGVGSEHSILSYKGTATDIDLMVVGGISAETYVYGCEAHGFQIQTETQMTAGSALVWQHIVSGSIVTDVSPDKRSYRESVTYGYRLYHGISFFNTNVTDYTDFLIGYIQGEGVRIYGQSAGDTASDIYLDKGTMVGCAKAGLHLGGGFGGLQVGEILMFGNYTNARITTELCSRHNREIFFRSDSVFDGAYVYALEIDDALSGGSSITVASFMGSSGLEPGTGEPRPDPTHLGDNIYVKNWNGVLTIKSDKVFNAKRHGIHIADPDTIVMISDNVFIQTCGLGPDGGYGIYFQNPTNLTQVAQNIYSNAKFGTGFLANNSGDFNALTGIGNWTGYKNIGLASSVGSLGSSWSGMYRFKTIDQNTEHFSVTIDIPNNGDGSGHILMYLPKNAAFAFPVYGFDESSGMGLSGVSLNNSGYPGIVRLVKSTGEYPASSGCRLLVSGTLVSS